MLKKTKKALELIAHDQFFADYDVRFVGGTALSYMMQHRLSEDLDFATLKLPKDEIIKMMLKYGATKKEHSTFVIDSAANDGFDIDDCHVMFELNGVKVDFFEPPFNTKEKAVWTEVPYTHYKDTNIKLAAFDTIMYMMFHERVNDEGLNTLVDKPKAYEWYRNKIEAMLDDVYMRELYHS